MNIKIKVSIWQLKKKKDLMKLKSEALSDMSGVLIRRGRDTSSVVYGIFLWQLL